MKYISTDIDRIIEYLKNRKKAELIEVSRALEINPMDVEKWAQILENEGMIELEHTFTKMYLIWLETNKDSYDTVVLKTGVRGEKKSEKPSIKEALSHIVPKTTTSTTIETKKELPPTKVELPVHKDIKVPQMNFNKVQDMSSDIEERMRLINNTMNEIAELKAEKQKLNNSEYVTKISKYDAQLQSLDEKLAERELAVMSLKMKLKNIPEVLKTVSVEFNGASKTYYDLEKEYRSQLEGLNSLKSDVTELRKDLQTEIKYSKQAVNVCSESLGTLDEQIDLVNKLREDAKEKIIEANMNIERERNVINEMSNVLDKTNVRVEEMKSLLSDVNERIGKAKDTFDEISEYETKLIEAEDMLKNIEKTYSLKLNNLRKTIEDSEREATNLNIELEKSFMANYVKELDNLSKNYSKDIGHIRKKDEELERKIKEAQDRLSKSLRE